MAHETEGGLSIGALLAAVMSWMKWHSVFLAVIHFFFGWFYVIYYVLKYGIPKW